MKLFKRAKQFLLGVVASMGLAAGAHAQIPVTESVER